MQHVNFYTYGKFYSSISNNNTDILKSIEKQSSVKIFLVAAILKSKMAAIGNSVQGNN